MPFAALLPMTLLTWGAGPPDTASKPPNIVFILIDDLGYGDIRCFNEDLPVATPRMDRLAKEGIRFTQFYVASPICSPSRVAFTTGQYPARHRIHSYLADRQRNRERGMANFLDAGAPSIARAFQAAGWATAHFGKWHMGGGRDIGEAPLPQEYGFAESLVSFEGLGDRILPPGRLSEQSEKLGRGAITHVAKHEQTGGYVDRAIDFIRRNRQRQFYLHLWLNDVHDAHVPREGAADEFANVTDNQFERKFFAVLTAMDRQIGRLIDAIDEMGLDTETLIVLTSDNGPTAWPRYEREGVDAPGSTAGFRGRKWSLYEGGIRMPLIARWNNHIPAGMVDRTTVLGSVDFLPTFTAIADIETSETFPPASVQRINANPPPPQNLPMRRMMLLDGQDMSDALFGRPLTRVTPLFWEYGRDRTYLQPARDADRSPNLAIRSGEWKLLVNDDGSHRELYRFDAQGRIDETRNVAAEFPAVADRLRREVLTWRASLPKSDP